jgi:AcrR family transcriptional regulator
MTIRAVAERAHVNERTVYRHFINERGLRDAVMQRQEQTAGIELTELRLEDVAEVATRIIEHVASYPIESRRQLDPTLRAANERQHEALLRALAAQTEGWSERDRVITAAMLDLLWSVSSYERVVVDWDLDQDEARRGVTWVIRLVEAAVRQGQTPA